MKKLLIPALLLAAASSYGQLTTATGARLTDYTNWFAPEFKVASDGYVAGEPNPKSNIPNGVAADTVNRDWSGWTKNFGVTKLNGPITAPSTAGFVTKVEFAFLGETAGWWDNIGYRLNGVDTLLASGIQAAGAMPNRHFGDYAELTLNAGDTLDFFVVATEKFAPNSIITPTPVKGGKYFVFSPAADIPVSATNQSYYGTMAPLTNARVVDGAKDLKNQAFTVLGFEDVQLTKGADQDYNDIVFGFRSGSFRVDTPPSVPEPSTYGLIGAVALLGLAGFRRFKKA